MIEQKVLYDWKPTLCKFWKKYGHSEDICKKKNVPKPTQKEQEVQPVQKQVDHQKNKDGDERQVIVQSQGAQKESSANTRWVTPMKTGRTHHKQDQQIVKVNSFQVLNRPGTSKQVMKETVGNERGSAHSSFRGWFIFFPGMLGS